MTIAASASNKSLEDGADPAWEGIWGVDQQGAYLIVGNCRDCGGSALGVREFCPHCHAEDSMEAQRQGRRGRLYTATVIHQAPPGFEAPYRVGYVDIDGGVRIFAHIDDGQDAPIIGDQVELTVVPVKTDPEGAHLTGPHYRKLGT